MTAKYQNKIITLSFPPAISGQPVISNLSKLYDLTFNILKARINPRREGEMTMQITGTEEAYKLGITYLQEKGIKVSTVAQQISRDEDSCIHCGICTAMCPTKALHLDLETRLVHFDIEKCSACGICTKVCSVHAMHVELDNDL